MCTWDQYNVYVDPSPVKLFSTVSLQKKIESKVHLKPQLKQECLHECNYRCTVHSLHVEHFHYNLLNRDLTSFVSLLNSQFFTIFTTLWCCGLSPPSDYSCKMQKQSKHMIMKVISQDPYEDKVLLEFVRSDHKLSGNH